MRRIVWESDEMEKKLKTKKKKNAASHVNCVTIDANWL